MASATQPNTRKGRIYETHAGVLEVDWPTAGKRTYDAITTVLARREGSTLPAERLSIYSDSTDAELDAARVALANAHNAVVLEIKRRAEKPADPRDAKIAALEKALAELKAQATPTPVSTPTPAASSTPKAPKPTVAKAAAAPKTAEQELLDLPF